MRARRRQAARDMAAERFDINLIGVPLFSVIVLPTARTRSAKSRHTLPSNLGIAVMSFVLILSTGNLPLGMQTSQSVRDWSSDRATCEALPVDLELIVASFNHPSDILELWRCLDHVRGT